MSFSGRIALAFVCIVGICKVAQSQEIAPYQNYKATLSLVSSDERINEDMNYTCEKDADCTSINLVEVLFYNGATFLGSAEPNRFSSGNLSFSMAPTQIVIRSRRIDIVEIYDMPGVPPQRYVTYDPSEFGYHTQVINTIPKYNTSFQLSTTEYTAKSAVFDVTMVREPELNGVLSASQCQVTVPPLMDKYTWGNYQYRVVDRAGSGLTPDVAGNGTSSVAVSLAGFNLTAGETYYLQINHSLAGTTYLTRFPFTAKGPITASVIDPDPPLCVGNNGEIKVSGVSGGSQSGYRAAVVEANAPEPADAHYTAVGTSFTVSKPPASYDVWIKDNSGCSAVKLTSGVTVGAASALTASINEAGVSDAFCEGISSGKITFNMSGGDGSHYEYAHNGPTFSPITVSNGSWELTNLAAGLHTVKLKVAGCSQEVTLTRTLGKTQGAPGVVLDEVIQPGCPGTNGQAKFTLSGGNAYGYQYSLDNGSFQTATLASGRWTADAMVSGEHSLTFRIVGCQETATKNVVIAPAPSVITASATPVIKTGTTHISCNGGNDGEVVVADLAGGTAPAGFSDYSISLSLDGTFLNGTTNTAEEKIVYSNLGAGDYVLEVRDKNACVRQIPVVVSEPDLVTINAVLKEDEVCQGAHDGKITATMSGGTGSYTVRLWNNGNEGTDAYLRETALANETQLTYLAVSPGNYRIGIKDSNGCPETWRVSGTVTIGAPPSALGFTFDAIAPDTRLFVQCKDDSNGSIKVVASGGWGGYAYSSNNVDFIDDGDAHVFSGLSAGERSFQVRDAHGCTREFSVSFEEPSAALTLNGSAIQPRCPGEDNGTISLTASEGWGSYQFSPDGSTYYTNAEHPDQFTFEGFVAGQYQVYVKDQKGCVRPATIEVSDRPELVASLASKTDITCHGRNTGDIVIELQGGTSPYEATAHNTVTGLITESDNETNFDALVAGEYDITVIDKVGCRKVIPDVEIHQPDALAITVGQLVLPSQCGESDGRIEVTLSGGSAQFESTWYRDGSVLSEDEDLLNIASGRYLLRVADQNDLTCFVESSIGVSDRSAPSITIESVKPVTCLNGADGAATIRISGAAEPFVITWPNGINTETIEGLQADRYVVEVQDALNCVVTETVEIGTLPVLAITTVEQIHPSCPQMSDGQIAVSVVNAQGNAKFTWNDGHADETQRLQLAAGNYTVSVKDDKGCTASHVYALRDPLPVVIQTIRQSVLHCYNDCDGEIQTSAAGGSGNYQYTWSSDNWTGTPETASVNGLCAGIYTASLTDDKGCSTSKIYTLLNPLEIAITPSVTPPTCFDATDGKIVADTRNGVAPYLYTWSYEGWSEAHSTPEDALEGLHAGVYELTLTDALGCKKNTSVTLVDPPKVEIKLDEEIYLCGGESIALNAGYPGSTYKWTSDKGFSAGDQVVTIGAPAQYEVEVTTAAGCIGVHRFAIINSNELLKANFLLSSEAVIGDTVVMIDISFPAPSRIQWDVTGNPERLQEPDSYYQEFKYYQAGEEEVTLYAYKGDCMDVVTKQITLFESKEALEEKRSGLGYEGLTLQQFDLFPNPNNGTFKVTVEFNRAVDVKLTAMPLDQTLSAQTVKGSGQSHYEFDLSIANAANGVHILYLEADKIREVIKFVVQ